MQCRTILNAPIVIAASRISKKKAKEALAASSVKIEGRDVLASWKLMVALVLVPIVYLFYTIVTFIFVNWGLQLSSPWTWAIPCIEFLGLPYISLVALAWGETASDIYKYVVHSCFLSLSIHECA
jgi:glycerol-3-phosphate O-acyltransferase/dihydroxyacetone phosphate acyltransferase